MGTYKLPLLGRLSSFWKKGRKKDTVSILVAFSICHWMSKALHLFRQNISWIFLTKKCHCDIIYTGSFYMRPLVIVVQCYKYNTCVRDWDFTAQPNVLINNFTSLHRGLFYTFLESRSLLPAFFLPFASFPKCWDNVWLLLNDSEESSKNYCKFSITILCCGCHAQWKTAG